MNATNPSVGFAGMTHLGINSAVATAERGCSVICYDADSSLIKNLKQNILPVIEPSLPELLTKNSKKITFTDQLSVLSTCDVVYIAADVPTNDCGESILSGIEMLIESVVPNLSAHGILVILCQVPPGFTRSLERLMPLKRLYYQVETLIFGCAIERALNPERFIVGCYSPDLPIDAKYRELLTLFACPILPMRYESAELAKISINCCLVSSIAVANTLSEICEHIGADWSEIMPALKLDKRIGQSAYLTPGLGIAGGNLERDLNTVLKISSNLGTESGVVSAWLKNNQHRRDWVLRTLHNKVLTKIARPTIAVLGLSYKENTHSIKNSPSISLLSSLKEFVVQAFDPVVSKDVVPNINMASSALAAVCGADCLIIMTPWPEFRNLLISELSSRMIGKVIIDPFQILNGIECVNSGFKYYTLGKNKVC